MTLRSSPMVRAAVGAGALAFVACDNPTSAPSAMRPSTGESTRAIASPAPPAEPARAPDIIVDPTNVSIGTDRVSSRELGLSEKVAVLVRDRPAIAGHTVDVVAMRTAKPSQLIAVVAALRRAGAAGAAVKTDARDGTTQRLSVSFATSVADCAPVAWIAKDAAIDVWASGGGRARRIVRGLAGPDMTLGSEAVRERAGGCNAPELVTGADDALTWGLVFDLASASIQALGARTTAALLVSSARPGRKVILP